MTETETTQVMINAAQVLADLETMADEFRAMPSRWWEFSRRRKRRYAAGVLDAYAAYLLDEMGEQFGFGEWMQSNSNRGR